MQENTSKYFLILVEKEEWENSWTYNKSTSIFERKSLRHNLLVNFQTKQRCIAKLFMDTQSLRTVNCTSSLTSHVTRAIKLHTYTKVNAKACVYENIPLRKTPSFDL